MPGRPPPFALVLSVLVAGAALAIVLAGGGRNNPPSSRQTPTIGIGATHACVTTDARAQVVDRSAVVITATVQAPVRVTEQASGPRGIATVTRSEVLTARVRGNEPVEVRRTSDAHATACANGASSTAARSVALRHAYVRALGAARALAAKHAAGSLTAVMHRRYPVVLALARGRAALRAHRLALAAEASLAAQAKAQARQRAGG